MSTVEETQLHRSVQIRSVWDFNLVEELEIIRRVASWCKYVTIDTEFPGVVYQAPTHHQLLSPDQRYSVVKQNVDRLKLIQLGLTLATSDDSDGSYHVVVWEFNFRGFHPIHDMQAPDSVQLLKSQGIDLWKNYIYGVDPRKFAELFKFSGLLCRQSNVTWLAFHGAYDFAYLIKALTGTELPYSMEMFLNRVRWFFGFRVYDIKHICKSCDGLCGGLERVAGELEVERAVGNSHQAGSDSLLAWDTFKRMKCIFFRDGIEVRQAGILCGIHEC